MTSHIDKETIDNAICDLLRVYGPDGHIDGSEKIAEFVFNLLNGDSFDQSLEKVLPRSAWCYSKGIKL